jgi:putative peptidoglycan lipid II flippase
LLFLLSVVAVLEIFADPLARFMAVKESAETQALTVGLVRVILLGIIFLGVSSIMMATLQALQRFAWSALSLAARNGGVVLIALLFGHWLGVWSLVLGVLVGTFLLIVLQAPGLRDLPLRPSLNFRHPAIGEILRLYRPIFLGLIVTSAVLIIDRNLANQTGPDSIGAMRYATTLQQFVLGLVGSACYFADALAASRRRKRPSAVGFVSPDFDGRDEVAVCPDYSGDYRFIGPCAARYLDYLRARRIQGQPE